MSNANSIKKILVTGGAGYIGAVLTPALLARGYAVTVVDNFTYGQTSLLDCCHNDRLTIIRGDVRDDLIKQAAEQADVIMPWPAWWARRCARSGAGSTLY